MNYGTAYGREPKVWILGREALALIECDKLDDIFSANNECACELENDTFTLCEEHKSELDNLKSNPPQWAIRARRAK